MLDGFQHSFCQEDKQMKIMLQIQSINKRLTSNLYSIKNQNEVNKKNENFDQKYFSQQCEELFGDQINLNKQINDQTLKDSLFNDNNQMLLDNEYEKEIKNFKEFETNQYSSQGKFTTSFSNKQNQNIDSLKFRRINSQQVQENNRTNNQTIRLQTKQSSNKVISLMKASQKSKSQVNVKKIAAQSKIKKYIENKQNCFPASNLQKKQPYIKEVQKKLKFDQKIKYNNFQISNHTLNVQIKNEDSLEFFHNQHTFKNNKCSNHANKNENLQDNLIGNYKHSKRYETHQNQLQCTFKPNILKKSYQIAENLQPSFQRLTQNIIISKSQSKIPYRNKQQLSTKKYSVKRLEQMSKPRRLKTMTDQQEVAQKYVFRPSLSKKSLQQMANCTLNVAERNKLWLEQKEAKISRLKTQQEQVKLKKQMGTFAPKINNYKGQSQVHLSRFAKEGMSNYFERISMAKQRNSINEKKIQIGQQRKDNPVKIRKKTYDEAVRQLHQKIMTMNI